MSSGSMPKIPESEPIETVETATETAGEAAKKKKKKIATQGRQSTILSGIQSSLQNRLGG